jgi:hypothetical protein
MAQLDDLFKNGVISEASMVNASLPSRAQEIFVMIQDIVERAAHIRRQDQANINSEWFTAESQLKIRQQVNFMFTYQNIVHCKTLYHSLIVN